MMKVNLWHKLAERHPTLNLEVAEEEFVRMLSLGERLADKAPPLSGSETELLDKAGFRPPTKAARSAAISKSAAAQAALIGDSITTAQAAGILKKTPGRIRQMISEGRLVSAKSGKLNLLPRFQFAVDEQGNLRAVPHSEQVFSALPVGLALPAIANWFLRPNDELYPRDIGVDPEARDKALSPKEGLLQGLEPDPVIAAARDIAGEPTLPEENEPASMDAQITAVRTVLKQIDYRSPSKVKNAVKEALRLLKP